MAKTWAKRCFSTSCAFPDAMLPTTDDLSSPPQVCFDTMCFKAFTSLSKLFPSGETNCVSVAPGVEGLGLYTTFQPCKRNEDQRKPKQHQRRNN